MKLGSIDRATPDPVSFDLRYPLQRHASQVGVMKLGEHKSAILKNNMLYMNQKLDHSMEALQWRVF